MSLSSSKPHNVLSSLLCPATFSLLASLFSLLSFSLLFLSSLSLFLRAEERRRFDSEGLFDSEEDREKRVEARERGEKRSLGTKGSMEYGGQHNYGRHGHGNPYGQLVSRSQMQRTQEVDSSLHAPVNRRILDYSSTVISQMLLYERGQFEEDSPVVRPVPVGALDLLPANSYKSTPASNFNTKFVHVSTNKIKCPVNALVWTPGGRRLLTGCQSGEFTLWNGMCFNFETIIQAHQRPVQSMKWTHNENWLITGDDGGTIQYWTTTLNKAKQIPVAHRESVRDLTFSPSDFKFASGSDDTTVKIWDFAEGKVEQQLSGHGGDVKGVSWHPKMGLVASCSKDRMIKLWDPKAGKALTNLHGHKSTVMCLEWNRNGNWILSGGRDQTLRVFDIRMMKMLQTYKGQNKDITSLCWHPIHEDLFVSGGYDGSVLYWLVSDPSPKADVRNAHETAVRGMAWHPMGHVIATCSHDNSTKFWGRTRPGDTHREKPKMEETYMPTAGLNVPQSLSVGARGRDAAIPGLGPMGSPGSLGQGGLGDQKRARERFIDTDRNKRPRYDNNRGDNRGDNRDNRYQQRPPPRPHGSRGDSPRGPEYRLPGSRYSGHGGGGYQQRGRERR